MISEPTYHSLGSTSAIAFDLSPIFSNNTVIIGLIISLVLLSYVIASDKGKLKLVFSTLLGEKNFTQNVRDKISYTNRSTILLFVNYILCVALLIISIQANFDWIEVQVIPLMATSIVVLITGFLLKRALIWLTGLLTGTRTETQDYLFLHSIYTIATGIALIPLLSLLHFSKMNYEFVLSSCIIFLILFSFLRVSISTLIAIKNRIGNLFYIFLYICSLEILPLVALYKAFVSEML